MSDDLAPTPTFLTSADGTRLEAVVHRPTGGVPSAVAAIAHPHPQYGGDMHNNVVAALRTGLGAAGVATVSFNFRGVGDSTGRHGGGEPERDDLAAAVDAAAALAADVPVFVCGYSFGADVALTTAHARLAAWIVVAPPLRLFADDRFVAATDPRPVHLITGEHDQFAAPPVARAATAGWRTTTVHPVEMADHFFAGATARVAALATELARACLPAG